MGAQSDILERIAEIEAEVRTLHGELSELRARVTAEMTAEPHAEASARRAPARPAPVVPPAPARPAVAALGVTAAIDAARSLLADGRPDEALDTLEAAATAPGVVREDLLRLAVELEGIARYRRPLRKRALEIAGAAAARARGAESPAAPVPPAPAPAPAAPQPLPLPVASAPRARQPVPASAPVAEAAAASAPPPAPPAPPRRTLGDLARDWDLLGPRGFAIVGGAVTGLGIILLFVLAANRGWITPSMRVVIGFAVSAAAVGAGLLVRRRYGQMQASLGAVGAGIAGAYATLAAAAARYDVVPDELALPLAGLIAAVAVAIALAWRSEIVAGIGLLGSALAPALQAIDTGLSWTSAAFAVIVLAATVAVAVPRRWHLLFVSIGVVVTGQVLWLAGDAAGKADAGVTATCAALVLVLLVAATALQIATRATDLDALAGSVALSAFGLALLLVPLTHEDRQTGGYLLLGAALAWAVAWAALRVRQPSFALVVGVSSLALAAVACADLLSGATLAVTWAAQSILLSILAWRLRDVRLQAMALVYVGLAAAHAWGVDAPPDAIFRSPVAGAAAVSVAAVAAALLAAGLLAPAETEPRTETGLLAWLASVRSELALHRLGLQEALVFAGVATATYSGALALVSASFRTGHLAATLLAASVGAAVTAVSARRASMPLAIASLAWIAGVLVVAISFDVPEFATAFGDRSFGGWAEIAAAAGVLAGTYAFQLLLPTADWATRARKPGSWSLLNPYDAPVVGAVGGIVALAACAYGIQLLAPELDAEAWVGWRLLAPALVFAVLSAAVFRTPRFRNVASWMWGLALAALLASEWLVVSDPTWRTLSIALTAVAVAALERPLRETRFWFAGWGIAVATCTLAVSWSADPSLLGDGVSHRLAIGPFAAAAATFVVAALAWGSRRDFVTVAWAVGVVTLVDAEAFLIQDATWLAAAVSLTAAAVAALERPLGESRLWVGGWLLGLATAAATLVPLALTWIDTGAEPVRYAIGALAVFASLAVVSALAWGTAARRAQVTLAWGVGIVALIVGEAFLVGGGPTVAFTAALTGGAVAMLATPFAEERLWWAGTIVVSFTSGAVLAQLMPPSHFVTASETPGANLWVAVGCLAGAVALHLGGTRYRAWVDAIASVGALYVLSLGILELGERLFAGTVQADFERGHVAVSVVWALIGLMLLIAGLVRDASLLRYCGLALFGLSLAKIFVYDLSALNAAARALSFIAVGALVLAGGFFLQRLSSHMGPRRPQSP